MISTSRAWHGQSTTAHVVTSQKPRAESPGSWRARTALVCVCPFSQEHQAVAEPVRHGAQLGGTQVADSPFRPVVLVLFSVSIP